MGRPVRGKMLSRSTVDSLLTHTPRFMLRGMGFNGVCGKVIQGQIDANYMEVQVVRVVYSPSI